MAIYQPVGRALAAMLVASAALAPQPALACNPFEFLFGNCRPSFLRPGPPPRRMEEPIFRQKRARSVDPDAVTGAKQVAIPPPPGARVGSIAHFAEDRTLRRGDVVVTPKGFLVYRGRDRKHTAKDFQPLGNVRGDLAKLERANRDSGRAYTPITTPLATKGRSPLIQDADAQGDREFSAKAD